MNILKHFMLGSLIAAAAIPCPAADDLGEPAITFHTNIYNENGAENSFHILLGATEKSEYFDIDMGFGNNEVEVGYASLNDQGAWTGTTVACRVSKEGVVNIYGDPTKIDVLIADGCSITDIDLSRCVNLDVLSLEHNQLRSLDLTPNTKLRAIYLSDNPGSAASPIKIGMPKPGLQILEADIIEWFDPDFRPDYPSLVSLDLYHNTSVKHLDLSGCPRLVNLVAEFTGIESLDLTPVPSLWHLNISETRVTDIDLSKVPELMEFLCSHTSGSINADCKVRNLDLSHNPKLTYLAASDNEIENLDISANTKLKTLYIRNNRLGSLNIDKNPDLYSVDLTGNLFSFSTLPAERETFGEYYYSQRPKAMPKSVAKDRTLHFPEMLRTDGETFARVMVVAEGKDAAEMEEGKYTWDKTTGDLSIADAPADSVYIEFANAALASYALTTSRFMVKEASQMGQPSRIVSFKVMRNTPVNFLAGLDGASASSPKQIFVDFGDGERKAFTITSVGASSAVTGTAPADPVVCDVTVWVPEGEVLTALAIDDLPVISADFTAARELRSLSAARCGLTSVNLSYNRCLTSLNLSGNKLSALDLAGIEGGGYEKNVLTRIEAANNRIASFNIVNTGGCRWLDLAGNRLAEFSLKDYDNMQHLDLSGNSLSEVNLAYMANADYISLADNSITSIEGVVEMPLLQSFDISGNCLTIPTLPQIECPGYNYAPQQPITIARKAPSVSLADQDVEISGARTTFEWVDASGTPLKEGVDYTIGDGKTRFLNTALGAVKCHISHPAFPKFAGADVLSTTEVQPMGAPRTVAGKFKVTELAEGGSSVGFRTNTVSNVYIDWTGDGLDFHDYPTSDKFSSSDDVPAEAAGHTAIIYTYDSPSEINVVSIGGIGMESFDASAMTGCTSFMLYGSGIDTDNLILPAPENLVELSLSGADASNLDLAKFPSMQHLSISTSGITSADLSKCPALLTAVMSGNGMENVKFGNPVLWGVDLSNNNLADIDLRGLPALSQILLNGNALSTIDLSPVASTLQAVALSQNAFRFSTLPDPNSLPALQNVFYYSNQAEVSVELIDGKVDLSSEAMIGDKATVYKWYYGEITIDPVDMTVTGEELVADGDDPEVTIENGVTIFHVDYSEPLTCVMTNEAYPNLILRTTPIRLAGISEITADRTDGLCDVYTTAGVAVRRGVTATEAVKGLDSGLYIVAPRNGGAARKVAVR